MGTQKYLYFDNSTVIMRTRANTQNFKAKFIHSMNLEAG